MVHEKTLIVDKNVARRIQKYLEEGGQEENINVTETAVFDDGTEMDIKCCGSRDETSWTEAVLYQSGCETSLSDPDGEYFTEWELDDDDGNTYIAHVVVES